MGGAGGRSRHGEEGGRREEAPLLHRQPRPPAVFPVRALFVSPLVRLLICIYAVFLVAPFFFLDENIVDHVRQLQVQSWILQNYREAGHKSTTSSELVIFSCRVEPILFLYVSLFCLIVNWVYEVSALCKMVGHWVNSHYTKLPNLSEQLKLVCCRFNLEYPSNLNFQIL